jgi:hypothetical protein
MEKQAIITMSIHHGLLPVVRNHCDRLVIDKAVAVLCLNDNHIFFFIACS